jgi:hypothetical protein
MNGNASSPFSDERCPRCLCFLVKPELKKPHTKESCDANIATNAAFAAERVRKGLPPLVLKDNKWEVA